MSPYAEGKLRDCLDCHRFPNIDTNEGVIASRALCMECHAKKECKKSLGKKALSLQLGPKSFEKSPHKYVACIQCHLDVARCPHQTRTGAQCLGCHHAHGEKTLHDPHLRIQCQACHHKSKYVFLDKKDDRVKLSHVDAHKHVIGLTDHQLAKVKRPELCLRCHYKGNKVGAAAIVLPSKGIICLLCHSTAFTIGHSGFLVALLIFIGGIVLSLLFWFKGEVEGEQRSLHRKISLVSERLWTIIFSREFWRLLKVFVLDVLLQRRILQESVRRWAIHSLIYLSILGRFFLGFLTLVVFRFWPESKFAIALIDKNYPSMAFIYDLLGLLILVGILWAAMQRFIIRPKHVVSEGQDNIALGIIGVLVVLGFLLEGCRILVTGLTSQVAYYSFIGYPISRLLGLLSLDWSSVYGVLWYCHALVGAIFVAYLPFGKMKHIINAPITLLMNYNR